MNSERKCDICGIGSDKREIRKVHEYLLCPKHKAQYYRHGKFIDETPNTTNDKNTIITHDDYAEIVITNKKNEIVGNAKIDLDDIDKVSQYKWRLEAGYVGAGNSKQGKLMLHRFVLGYTGELYVDHINRDVFDNRKCNLRVVPPVINAQNNGSKHVRLLKNGRFRAEIVRFNRYYSLGQFSTEREAREKVKEFLDYIKLNEDSLFKQFEDHNLHIRNIHEQQNGKYGVQFIRHNKRYHAGNIESVEEAIKIRDNMIREAEMQFQPS